MKMMMETKMRIDAEYLIKTVKKHECIWNRNCKEYQKKCAKEDAWTNICEELIDGWDDMEEETKLARQWELKKRWNNIRDYYRKDLAIQHRSTPIGQSKRKKYMFSKSLEFLRPVLSSHSGHAYDNQQEEEQDDQEVYLEEHLYSSDDDTSLLKRKEVKVAEDQNLDDTKNSYAIPPLPTSTEEDGDWLFLRSLLSDMKEMNKEQKLEFKMGVLKLYKDIMFKVREDEDENEDCKSPVK